MISFPPYSNLARGRCLTYIGTEGSGNDAIENIAVVEAQNELDEKAAPVHYLIKWNPRQESP